MPTARACCGTRQLHDSIQINFLKAYAFYHFWQWATESWDCIHPVQSRPQLDRSMVCRIEDPWREWTQTVGRSPAHQAGRSRRCCWSKHGTLLAVHPEVASKSKSWSHPLMSVALLWVGRLVWLVQGGRSSTKHIFHVQMWLRICIQHIYACEFTFIVRPRFFKQTSCCNQTCFPFV